MKESSQRVLLIMYPQKRANLLWIDYEQLKLIVPSLSYAGLRSLMSHLKRNGLVISQSIGAKAIFALSKKGQQEIEKELPFLVSVEQAQLAKMGIILLVKAPKTDPSFRYLRHLLSHFGAQRLSGGAYIISQPLPLQLLNECELSYATNILILSIGESLFGDLNQQILNKFSLIDHLNVYSGFSKELSQLLNGKELVSSLNKEQKQQFFSLFDRFITLVKADSGLIERYFPQEINANSLLAQLQKAIKL